MATSASAPEPPLEASAPSTPAPAAPTVGKPYNQREHREHTRARLAGGLAILLGIIGTLLICLTAAGSISLDDAKDLGLVVFSPIVVLTGTALGFYFGVLEND
jgi:hypothetical protein